MPADAVVGAVGTNVASGFARQELSAATAAVPVGALGKNVALPPKSHDVTFWQVSSKYSLMVYESLTAREGEA